MDCKQELVKRLKEDCEVLTKNKIPKSLENISDDKGVNTYRNLTKALADNIKLIEEYEKEEWKPMWSIYRTDDKTNPGKTKSQVAVWMQNDKGDIDNHQVFDIDYEVKENIVDGISNITFEKIEGRNRYDIFEETLSNIIELFTMNNQITIPVSELTRNVGKTTFLVNKAIENNGVVIVGHSYKVNYIKEYINKNVEVACSKNGIAHFPKDTTFYIDEEVSWDEIKHEAEKHPYVRLKYCRLNEN